MNDYYSALSIEFIIKYFEASWYLQIVYQMDKQTSFLYDIIFKTSPRVSHNQLYNRDSIF